MKRCEFLSRARIHRAFTPSSAQMTSWYNNARQQYTLVSVSSMQGPSIEVCSKPIVCVWLWMACTSYIWCDDGSVYDSSLYIIYIAGREGGRDREKESNGMGDSEKDERKKQWGRDGKGETERALFLLTRFPSLVLRIVWYDQISISKKSLRATTYNTCACNAKRNIVLYTVLAINCFRFVIFFFRSYTHPIISLFVFKRSDIITYNIIFWYTLRTHQPCFITCVYSQGCAKLL